MKNGIYIPSTFWTVFWVENIFLCRDFSNTETLCSEQKYYCETCCSKQEAQKRCVKDSAQRVTLYWGEDPYLILNPRSVDSWPSIFEEVSCLPLWLNKDKNACLETCPFVWLSDRWFVHSFHRCLSCAVYQILCWVNELWSDVINIFLGLKTNYKKV